MTLPTIEFTSLQGNTLPKWTNDKDKVLLWALNKHGHPKDLERATAQTATSEEILKLEKAFSAPAEERIREDIAWWAQSNEVYAFGWGSLRISLWQGQAHVPEWRIDSWCPKSGWILETRGGEKTTQSGFFIEAILGALKISKKTRPKISEASPLPLCSYRPKEAPWSSNHLFVDPDGVWFFPSFFSDRPPASDSFDRWVAHRYRAIARRFKGFRFVIEALRVRSHAGPQTTRDAFSLWESFERDQQWGSHPLLWLLYAACEHDDYPNLSGMFAYNPMIYDRNLSNIHALSDRDIAPRSPRLKSLTPFPKKQRQANSLPLKQAARWVEGLVQINPTKPVVPPGMLLQFLLENGNTIPPTRKLHALLSNKFLAWAWMLRVPGWTDPGLMQSGQFYFDAEQQEGGGKRTRKALEEAHAFYLKDPAKFELMVQAALAWMNAPARRDGKTLNETLDEDALVLNNLFQAPLAEVDLKERVNKNSKWTSFVKLEQFTRQAQLDETKDFLVPLPEADPNEPSWTTVLGILQIGTVSVFPLTRRSHMGTVGHVFDNCMGPDRSLDSYVELGLQGASRFFRLQEGQNHALLQISLKEATWAVQEIKAPRNRPPSTAMCGAGARVADLYTLLSSEALTDLGSST